MDDVEPSGSRGPSPTRLYGSAIAFVSGSYAVYLSTTGMAMTGSAWFMLLLGLVVIVHGGLLLTPVAHRMGSASGPLMILWAVLMLGHQAWLGWMGGGPMPMRGGMGWDAGMLSLAVLMLVSGAIMTNAPDRGPRTGM